MDVPVGRMCMPLQKGASLLFATRNALASSFSSQFTGRGNTNETEELRASRLNFLIGECQKVDVLFVQEVDSFSARSLQEAGFLVQHASSDLDLTKYGTAVCIRPPEGTSVGQALTLPSLESLEPKGKLPTVVPLQSAGNQRSCSWLISFHFQHPQKDRKAKVKNLDVLRAVQEAICRDPRYIVGQAIVCGLDGNAGAQQIRKLFQAPSFGSLRTGKVLVCGKNTCSRVHGTRLGGEEDDYFYIAGNVSILSNIHRGPLSFPFHADGSADFLLRKEGGTPIGHLCAVAASDHAQLEVHLALSLEDGLRPSQTHVYEISEGDPLVDQCRRVTKGKGNTIGSTCNDFLLKGYEKGKNKAIAKATAGASSKAKGKNGKYTIGKGKGKANSKESIYNRSASLKGSPQVSGKGKGREKNLAASETFAIPRSSDVSDGARMS